MNSKAFGQLAAVASLSSILSVGALLTYQSISRRRRRSELSKEIYERLGEESELTGSRQHEVIAEKKYEANETIIREQLARNYTFFGEEGMAKIRNSRVAVIGCGGVGSWASVMLVRS
jgi:tRNA threonylcarbamoyladenosine dehydratase